MLVSELTDVTSLVCLLLSLALVVKFRCNFRKYSNKMSILYSTPEKLQLDVPNPIKTQCSLLLITFNFVMALGSEPPQGSFQEFPFSVQTYTPFPLLSSILKID